MLVRKYSSLCARHASGYKQQHRPELVAPSVVPKRPCPQTPLPSRPRKPVLKDKTALDRYLEIRNHLSEDQGSEYVLLDVPDCKGTLKRPHPEQEEPSKRPKS